MGLLKAVQDDGLLTQRSAANELGIALGLVNTYIKRCVKKGFVKISQVPRNRYAYYLTPQGFAEKSRLTAEYLSQSLSLFRQSQIQFSTIFSECADKGWSRVAFYGLGDVSEIAWLCAQEFPITVVAVIQKDAPKKSEDRFLIAPTVEAVGDIDTIILTDLSDPQRSYNTLINEFPKERVFAPPFFEISHTPLVMEE